MDFSSLVGKPVKVHDRFEQPGLNIYPVRNPGVFLSHSGANQNPGVGRSLFHRKMKDPELIQHLYGDNGLAVYHDYNS
jgi:hypothetical protein